MEHSPPRTWPVLALLFVGVLAALGAKGAVTEVRSLPAIRSRAEFDALARVTDTPSPLPHLLFVIDRREKDRIYYVNSKRYMFHRDFVNSTYLSLEWGQEFFTNNFLKPNRRFILGTIADRARLSSAGRLSSGRAISSPPSRSSWRPR